MCVLKAGLIGYGKMGAKYLEAMGKSDKWKVAYIYDTSPESRAVAKMTAPDVEVVADEDVIFNDKSVDVVVLTALADSRIHYIQRAIESGKHIIAEKPVADCVANEWKAVDMVEHSGLVSTVDLYLRNSWYHNEMRDFIASGEIGELAILRICHMTPGLAPREGHEYEGPAFHDCGMHYVDIARWYAGAEYATWHAQGVRMWDYKDPWWLQCHGTFANGVVFDITQGFVYGQLSKDQTHNSYVDIIGTKGIARMTHDFKTARVELRGVTRTEILEKPYGDKNIDKLCDKFADSVNSGVAGAELPSFRDSVIASEYAWKFLDDARGHALPSIGTDETLEEILDRRRHMTNGYGLLGARKHTATI